MTESKLEAFTRAMYRAERYGDKFAKGIETCRSEKMSALEFNLWVEKTARELKLSKESAEKLGVLISEKYERNMWGVINGVTELAQNFTLDRRMDMESWAGEMFGLRVS